MNRRLLLLAGAAALVAVLVVTAVIMLPRSGRRVGSASVQHCATSADDLAVAKSIPLGLDGRVGEKIAIDSKTRRLFVPHSGRRGESSGLLTIDYVHAETVITPKS